MQPAFFLLVFLEREFRLVEANTWTGGTCFFSTAASEVCAGRLGGSPASVLPCAVRSRKHQGCLITLRTFRKHEASNNKFNRP